MKNMKGKLKTLVLGMSVLLICAGMMVTMGAAAKPGVDFEGEHYNLNVIGKKLDWNGGGSYDNPDRHTIFVPEDTSAFTIPIYDEGIYTELSGIKLEMTQGTEFAVLDGNAFDDGKAAFQLAPGRYNVYIAVKGKPGGSTEITGWVKCNNTYYFDVGDVRISKSKNAEWTDATGLFYVDATEEPDAVGYLDNLTEQGLFGENEQMWVFDYLTGLTNYNSLLYPADETAYFWQYDNHGSKLVQIRFYPI